MDGRLTTVNNNGQRLTTVSNNGLRSTSGPVSFSDVALLMMNKKRRIGITKKFLNVSVC